MLGRLNHKYLKLTNHTV